MSTDDHGGEGDALEALTEEFLARRRAGEPVGVEEFAAAHPQYAPEILSLFATLVRLEASKSVEPARTRERFGRWEVVREIGRGGTGVVYLAEDAATGERAAVKLLSAEQPTSVARFRREAQAVARVAHTGACRILDLGTAGSRPWIAFEYVEGETLAHAISRERAARDRGARDGAPPSRDLDAVLAVGERVAEVLHAAHEVGLVHRDVKPANVMLARDGRVVVLDFGLAQADAAGDETHITHTGMPVGTPAYMSPEQIHGTSRPDRRTDVYSLGATLYEALTLERPFEGPTVAALFSRILSTDAEPVRRHDPTISRDIEIVLATALEKDPVRRYATARDLGEDLARVRRGDRIRARPASRVRRLAAWARRHPTLAASAAAIGLALSSALVVTIAMLARVEEARARESASARRVRAQALVAASADASRNDAMLALLLAREAVRVDRTPDSVSRLHAAVHGSLERRRLEGHAGPVGSLGWSGDSSRVATGASDGKARLFDATGSLRAAVAPPGTPPGDVQVSLSRDGTRWATLTADGSADLWRDDGSRIVRLAEPSRPAIEVFFLSDGTVVTSGADGRVALHEPDGAPRASWTVPADAGDGDAIAGAEASERPLRLHVLARGNRVVTYDRDGHEVARREQALSAMYARLLPGGRLAYVEAASSEAAAGAVDPRGHTLVIVSSDGSLAGTARGSFGPGSLVAVGDDSVATWSAQDGGNVLHLGDPGRLARPLDLQRSERLEVLSSSLNGSRILTARRSTELEGAPTAATDAVRLWSSLGVPLCAVTVSDDVVSQAAFSPDGETVALVRHSGSAVLVDATAPCELATQVAQWRRGDGFRYPATFTPDGRHFLVLVDETHLRVVRDDGQVRSTIELDPGDEDAREIGVLGGGDGVLVTGWTGAVTLYDLDGAMRLRLPAAPRVQQAVALGRDGGFVTTVAGARVRFHDRAGRITSEVAGALLEPEPDRGHADEAAVLAGARVEVYGPDARLRRAIPVDATQETFWYHASGVGRAVVLFGPNDLQPGKPLATCRCVDGDGHVLWERAVRGGGVRAAWISRDGSRVVTGGPGGLAVFDGEGRDVASLPVPGGLASFTFDRAGTAIGAVSKDGLVRVFDVDGRLRFSLPPHGEGAYLAFSPDGTRILTVTPTMARLFTTDVDELLALAARRSTRALEPAERARFAEILDAPR